MEKINFSEKEFKDLKQLSLKKSILSMEGDLYLYKTCEDKVIKVYNMDSKRYLSDKEYTVNELFDNKEILPIEFCIPEMLVTINNKFKGFLMPLVSGINLSDMLSNKRISLKSKLSFFKQIGNMLEKLDYVRNSTHLNDIYLNDIHEDNFIVDKYGKIHVIDLDSVKIGKNDTYPSKYMICKLLSSIKNNKYELKDEFTYTYYVNRNTDLYCYNIMLLNFLTSGGVDDMNIYEYKKLLEYMDSINFDTNLLQSFDRITETKENINPYKYLDNVVEESIDKIRKYMKLYKR